MAYDIDAAVKAGRLTPLSKKYDRLDASSMIASIEKNSESEGGAPAFVVDFKNDDGIVIYTPDDAFEPYILHGYMTAGLSQINDTPTPEANLDNFVRTHLPAPGALAENRMGQVSVEKAVEVVLEHAQDSYVVVLG